MRTALQLELLLVLALLVATCSALRADLGQELVDAGDRVLFSGVTSLQFSSTKYAASEKGNHRPELTCVSGSASGFWWKQDWYPRVVSCVRYGKGDGGPNGADWRCKATVKKFLVLGETNVICERFGQEAKYILAGSCRLEYELNFSSFQVRFVHVLYGKVPVSSALNKFALKCILRLLPVEKLAFLRTVFPSFSPKLGSSLVTVLLLVYALVRYRSMTNFRKLDHPYF